MKRPRGQVIASSKDKRVIEENKNIDIYYKFKPFENGY